MYHVEGMEDHLLISSALLGNGRAKGHDDIEIRYLYMWLSYHGRVIYQRPSHFLYILYRLNLPDSRGNRETLRSSAIRIPCIDGNTVNRSL
jgi:hypothetical protein